MLDSPGNFPGTWTRQPISREVGCGSQFPGIFPGQFPGKCPISMGISREVGCGSRLPVEFPGESDSLDCGSFPCELIADKWGISARCRRAGGLLLMCRRDPMPFRVSRGPAPALCAPESVSPPITGVPRIAPGASPELERPDFIIGDTATHRGLAATLFFVSNQGDIVYPISGRRIYAIGGIDRSETYT